MALLTKDFLHNRRRITRMRRYILFGAILLALATSAAAGFYLYDKGQKSKNATIAEAQAAEGACTLPSEWLIKYFQTNNVNDSRVGGAGGDPDADYLTNCQEFTFGSDPQNPVTSGTGQLDGVKVAVGVDPVSGKSFFSTEDGTRIANQYLEANNLPDFKEENIQKLVDQVLSPEDPSKIEVKGPDPKALNVSRDNSPEAIDKYISTEQKIVLDLNANQSALEAIVADPNSPAVLPTSGDVYSVIEQLLHLSVPSDFVIYHQLQIAGLTAAANILDIAHSIDQTQTVEQQRDKYSEQYRNVQLIQRIDLYRLVEYNNLKNKYKDILDKYAAGQ